MMNESLRSSDYTTNVEDNKSKASIEHFSDVHKLGVLSDLNEFNADFRRFFTSHLPKIKGILMVTLLNIVVRKSCHRTLTKRYARHDNPHPNEIDIH